MAKECQLATATLILILAGLHPAAVGQAPVPIPPPPSTLWRFLGIPQTFTGAYDSVANRRGNVPGMERRGRGARVRRIADPAFLDPAAPPLLKTAAQIKMQEDLAPQKIKALAYLGSIGCGCYDKDGEVTAAILAGLADCTEEVRLAAVEVITEGACSEYCEFCRERSCCKPALAKKLDDMANGQDENGCWVEPSERVRAAAAQALAACGPIIVQSRPLQQQQIEDEESIPATPDSGEDVPRAAPLDTPATLPAPQADQRQSPVRSSRRQPLHRAAFTPRKASEHHAVVNGSARQIGTEVPVDSAVRTAVANDPGDLYTLFQPHQRDVTMTINSPQPLFESPQLTSLEEPLPLEPPHQASPSPGEDAQRRTNNTRSGVIEAVDEARGVVHVRFEHNGHIAAGTPVSILHRALIGEVRVSGRVDHWDGEYAIVRPFEDDFVGRIAPGDAATLYIPKPVRISR